VYYETIFQGLYIKVAQFHYHFRNSKDYKYGLTCVRGFRSSLGVGRHPTYVYGHDETISMTFFTK